MTFSFLSKISLPILLSLILFSKLFAEPKFYKRGISDIPSEILRKLENDYRKVTNLNGKWTVQSEEPYYNGSVDVPFCYDFKGKVTCKRQFNPVSESPDDWNYVLHCDGINYQCEIFINDKFIARHAGGFTPFSILLQDAVIKPSDNIIELRIDNTLDYSRTIPLKDNINYPKNYGGIYRDIYLISVPKVFIRNIVLKTEQDINLNLEIKNTINITSSNIAGLTDKNFNLKTEILDSAGGVRSSSETTMLTALANKTVQAANTLKFSSPAYWSYDNPNLYYVRVILSSGTGVLDIYESELGFLDWRFQPSNILSINRRETHLKGINYVEEFTGKGICGTYEDIQKDILNIKQLGCNAIKIYGRPASPYLLQICNKLGMMVMEEIPVFNVPAGFLGAEEFTGLAENELTEMIVRHKNNPSVIAYGLGNDFNVATDEAKNFVSRLTATAKSLDKRLVYYSTRNYFNDKCRGLTDLTGINLYDTDLKILRNIINDSKVKKDRIFIASFGKQIDPMNYSGYSDPSSAESQSKFIIDSYKIIKGSVFSGEFFHSYSDWNSDFPNLKYFEHTGPYLRTTGVYNLDRELRSSGIILRKINIDEDLPNLNLGSFREESPIIFVIAGISVFILFIYLTNSMRRLRENFWRALIRPYNFFIDVREQALVQPLYNIVMCVIISAGTGLFIASLLYYWKWSQLFDIMLSLIASEEKIKLSAAQIINSPFRLIVILSAVTFIKIFFISVIVWLFSLSLKFRVGFNNIYTITVWGFLPAILLLITGTFYYRILLLNSDFVIIGAGLAVILFLISFYRILRGTHIIFDASPLKTYFYGIVTIGAAGGAAWYYLNSTRYVLDYFRMVLTFLKY